MSDADELYCAVQNAWIDARGDVVGQFIAMLRAYLDCRSQQERNNAAAAAGSAEGRTSTIEEALKYLVNLMNRLPTDEAAEGHEAIEAIRDAWNLRPQPTPLVRTAEQERQDVVARLRRAVAAYKANGSHSIANAIDDEINAIERGADAPDGA